MNNASNALIMPTCCLIREQRKTRKKLFVIHTSFAFICGL
jgi:hypothetical protein